MLDEARQIDILNTVKDEGGYWEDRNAEHLLRTVGEWNEMIAGQLGRLQDILPNGLEVKAPIRAYGDYEHLEARGRRNDDTQAGDQSANDQTTP